MNELLEVGTGCQLWHLYLVLFVEINDKLQTVDVAEIPALEKHLHSDFNAERKVVAFKVD